VKAISYDQPSADPGDEVRAEFLPSGISTGEPRQDGIRSLSEVAQAPPQSSYPWGALLVVFAAGIVVGGVGVALFGSDRPIARVEPAAESTSSAQPASARGSAVGKSAPTLPPGTDVQVAPSPPPAAELRAAADLKSPVPDPAQTRAAATGRMAIKSVPAGAEVSLDGKARGRTPLTLRGLPFGTHEVVVSRSGFAAETRRVEVSAAQPAGEVLVELHAAHPSAVPPKPAEAKTGALDIDTRPRGATIVLDGKTLGVTPLEVAAVAAGSHELRVELSGYKSITTTIDVTAGQTTRFTVSLEHMAHPEMGRD
jgi:hypothetical protein